jgi:hypothetical protein
VANGAVIDEGAAREVEKGSSPPDVGHPATGRLVLEDDVQGVDDTGDITQDGEQDVDQEISSAAALQEDTQRWEDDGKNDFADVARGESHVGGG